MPPKDQYPKVRWTALLGDGTRKDHHPLKGEGKTLHQEKQACRQSGCNISIRPLPNFSSHHYMPRGLFRLGSLTIMLQRYLGLPRLAQMGTWEPCTAAPGSDTCSSSPPHLPLASPSPAMSQHPLTQIVESLVGGAVRSAPSAITQEKKMPLSKMRHIFKNHNLFWLAVSTSGWQYYNSLERNFHFEFQLGKLVAIFPFSESKGDH